MAGLGRGAGTAHSLLTLVLQECSTTLKSRGSCSKGTFTIFPGDKVGREELAVALVEEHVPLVGLKNRDGLFECLGQGKYKEYHKDTDWLTS